MIQIENNHYEVKIDPHGSQMLEIINKDYNFNYLWNGSEWPKHAPLLFPAIGRSNDDSYLLNNNTYSMPQHGFAADQDFAIANQTQNSVALELESNSKTKELYPFDFKLQTIYQLLSNGLSVNFKISNLSDKVMPFSIGSHPAFNVPISGEGTFEDYYLDFIGNHEPLKVYEIIKKPYPYRTGKLEDISTENLHRIKLNHRIFDSGLRIINNNDINEVILHSPRSKHTISLEVSDFNNVCIWTKEEQDLPFLCIEPFNGFPDIYGKPIDWYEKQGNLFLNPQEGKLIQYKMKLL